MSDTIAKSFSTYMEAEGYGIFGTDLFIGSAPDGALDDCWWIIFSGGSSQIKNKTGERVKVYVLDVYHRGTDSASVDQNLQAFEEQINSIHCDQLDGFDTVEMEAVNFASDQDLDVEDRSVGLVQVQVTVYQGT